MIGFMKRFSVCLFILFLVSPATAQEIEPEVTQESPVVINVDASEPTAFAGLSSSEVVLLAVIIVLLVGLGYLLRTNKELQKELANALPEWAVDLLDRGSDTGLAELEEITDETPNKVDDELIELLKKERLEFFEEIRRLRQEIDQSVDRKIETAKSEIAKSQGLG